MEKVIKTKQKITQSIDPLTGELLDVTEQHIDVLVNPDSFMLIYTKFLDAILEKNLTTVDIELLAYLLKNYAKGQHFAISSFTKEEVALRTKKAPSSYHNCTRHLLEAGFIYEVKSKIYRINPQLAFEGSSSTRNQLVVNLKNFK